MPESPDQLADAVERALRDLGAWSEPPPELRPFRQPFAMDTMPFEHWLQLVLVPRLREIAAAGSPLPARSNLAAHAVREFDGRDEMHPLVDVLRRIDERCPPPAGPPSPGMARRLGAGVALILLLSAWGALAVAWTTRLTPALARFFPATVVQTWVGSRAPGADLQPLRVTAEAAVTGDGALRVTDASLIVVRSLRTLTHGPTTPLRFAADAPPTASAIQTWLAGVGADPDAPAAREASAEALAVLAAARAARTAAALHDAGASLSPPLRAEQSVAVPPHAPAWLQNGLVALLALVGAIPIAIVVTRFGLRRG